MSVAAGSVKASYGPLTRAILPSSRRNSSVALTNRKAVAPPIPTSDSPGSGGTEANLSVARSNERRTVRSAPLSMRKRSRNDPPSGSVIQARTLGRLTPSSQRHHSPLMSIQSRATLGTDVLRDHTIILGVSGYRLCPGLFLAVRDERLLPGNGDESSPHPWQQFWPMGLKPCLITSGTFILSTEARNLVRIVHFLDDELWLMHLSSNARSPGPVLNDDYST